MGQLSEGLINKAVQSLRNSLTRPKRCGLHSEHFIYSKNFTFTVFALP